MKKLNVILTGILIILLSSMTAAQPKTGFEYFKGKWNVVAASPNGDVLMIVGFEKSDEKIIGTIKNSDGNELYKVTNTSINEKEAILKFEGSQGEVTMVLTKRDEDQLAGDIMGGVVSATGVRIKEK